MVGVIGWCFWVRSVIMGRFCGHVDWICTVGFNPDGRILASGSDDQTIRLWEVSSGELLQTLSGHTHWVRSVVFSPDGKFLASGSFDQTIRLWEVSSGKLLASFHDHTSAVTSMVF